MNLLKSKYSENNKVLITIGYIQMGTSIYSDLSTLLISLLISYKIYNSSTSTKTSSSFLTSIKGMKIICTLIPFTISISMCVINSYVFHEMVSKEDCKPWTWVHSYLSFSLYFIYWIIIIISVVLACGTIHQLNKKNQMLNQGDESDDFKEDIEPFSNPVFEVSLSDKISSTVKKLYYFPIIILFIWIILTFDRLPDDILYLLEVRNVEVTFTPFLTNLKKTTLVFNILVSSLKGIIMCSTFIWLDRKLFESLKTMFICSKERRTIPSFGTEIVESIPPNEG